MRRGTTPSTEFSQARKVRADPRLRNSRPSRTHTKRSSKIGFTIAFLFNEYQVYWRKRSHLEGCKSNLLIPIHHDICLKQFHAPAGNAHVPSLLYIVQRQRQPLSLPSWPNLHGSSSVSDLDRHSKLNPFDSAETTPLQPKCQPECFKSPYYPRCFCSHIQRKRRTNSLFTIQSHHRHSWCVSERRYAIGVFLCLKYHAYVYNYFENGRACQMRRCVYESLSTHLTGLGEQ